MPLPCGHLDEADCQDHFQRHDQPFGTVKECVEHFLSYYKECLGRSQEAVCGPILSHVIVAMDRGQILSTSGCVETVKEMIAAAWEST